MTISKKTADLTTQSSVGANTGELQNSPIHLLHRAGQCAGDIFQNEMNEAQLTPRQFAVLASVSQNEGLSQTNLVEMTGIDRSTLADIIRRMLKKGLIQRRRAKQDARAYSVKLTDQGRNVLRATQPVVRRVDEQILSALAAPERKQFLKDLTSIIVELGKIERETDTVASPTDPKIKQNV